MLAATAAPAASLPRRRRRAAGQPAQGAGRWRLQIKPGRPVRILSLVHGSATGALSVRHPNGKYGSVDGAFSAMSPNALTPPLIVRNGRILAALTNNVYYTRYRRLSRCALAQSRTPTATERGVF